MADFTANMTDTVAVDDSIKLLFETQFLIANQEQTVMDQFAQYRVDIGAKSIEMTKYANLAAATTPLTEKEDVVSEALVDSAILLTPEEYGKAVTTTKLANLQSGGQVDTAAAMLVGNNAALTQNKLAVAVLEAGSNVLTADGTAETALTASDVMTVTFLNVLYNKLSRGNVPKFDLDSYVAVLHDDVIHDLRNATGAGSWQDAVKYTSPETMLKNEVGMLGGFRIVRSNDISINEDAGATTTDTYHSLCFGANAFGKAVSSPIEMVMKPANDKLNRFMDVGWKSCLKYGLIDTDNLWIGTTASSVGANT